MYYMLAAEAGVEIAQVNLAYLVGVYLISWFTKKFTIFYSVFRSESLIYYMLAAEAGVEVAQFNLAYLCEEDHVSGIGK